MACLAAQLSAWVHFAELFDGPAHATIGAPNFSIGTPKSMSLLAIAARMAKHATGAGQFRVPTAATNVRYEVPQSGR
jgi:hypothetical protein